MTDCRQLLADYAHNRSEPAFCELVARYLNLVYSSALRLVGGDEHRAKDVAQIVFTDLARKAGELSPDVMLGGWLHRHTCFVAANTMRGERRRIAREREAAEMHSLQENAGADFTRLAPLLDETINQLDEDNRTAILLRFFEQKDFRTVGQSIDTSEDAARMRVNRALEKLRELLAQRGIRTTAGALGIVTMANAVQAAPPGLAVTISAAALMGTAATASSVIATTSKAIAMTTLQKTLVTATVAVLAGAGIYEGRQAAQLRKQVQTLQRQQAPLGAQIRQLQQERDDATNQLALLTEDIAKNKKDNLELLKLRGEVGVLRNQLAEAKLKATQSSASSAGQVTSIAHRPGTYISKDELEFVGYATPEAALESISWALYRGTYEQANEGLGPDLRAGELEDPKRKQSFEAGQAQAALVMKGIQIVAMKVLADDKVELKVKSDYDPEALKRFTSHLPPEYMVQPMVKIGNEWKLGGSTRGYQATWESDGQIQNFVP